MALPRITVRTVDAPPALAAPTTTTKRFIVTETELGPLEPVALTSMRGWQEHVLGERTSVGIPGWDAVDVGFRHGVPLQYVSRIVGPDATKASLNVPGGSGTSVVLTAANEGEWANGAAGGLKAAVTNGPSGGTTRMHVIYRGGSTDAHIVDQSPEYTVATKGAVLEAWAGASNPDRTAKYVTAVGGADTGLPTVAVAANLAGGDADTAAITTTEIREALDRIPKSLGPGVVLLPWRTTAASHQEVLEHCAENNRTCILDGAKGASVSTLTTLAATLEALGDDAEGIPRRGGLFAQYATGPGVTPGTTREVPYSVVVSGLLARAELAAGHPNVQPIGEAGVSDWVDRLDRYFDETEGGDADDLTDAGINVAVDRGTLGIRNYTFESLDTDSEWSDLAHSHYVTSVVARAEEIGERLRDGRLNLRRAIPRFGSLLRLMLASDFASGALDGETQDDAFRVNVESVNDDDTIAAQELNAEIGVKLGEHVRDVSITIAKTPVNQSV